MALQLKRYELLPSKDVSVPIFTQVSKKQRVRQTKLPMWSPLLKFTVTDEEGNNETLRLKLNANSIKQDEQIKKNIDANAKFTKNERMAPRFIYGTLLTSNPIVQTYLESIPPFEGFKGVRDGSSAQQPSYKLVDEAKDTENENEFIRKQMEAGTYVLGLKKEGATELLISLFGSAHPIPETVTSMQNELVFFIQENEDGADKVLAKRESADDKTKVLIGKAVQAGILSFDHIPGQVAMKISGKFKGVKEIPSAFELEAKESRFIEHLNSKDGEALKKDLVASLKKANAKTPA